MKITSKQLKIIIKEELKPLLEAYSAGRGAVSEADRPYTEEDRKNTNKIYDSYERFFRAIGQDLNEHGRRIKAMEDKIKSLMGSSGENTDPQ